MLQLKLFIVLSLCILQPLLIECDLQITRVNSSDTPYDKFHMVTDIQPIRYHIDISLEPTRNFQYYNATSKIEFRSNVRQNFVAFHFKLSHLIDVHDIGLVNLATADNLTNFNVTYFKHGDDPLIGLESNEEQFLQPDTVYSLNIGYTVRFDEGERNGFFKYCYQSDELEDSCFATTHFEVHNIRLSFPSFDNSTLKARFNIRVKHRSDMMAQSNMPGRIVDHADETVTTVFDESPPMSTYLIAIAVGRFDRNPIDTLNNLTMNLYTPIGIGKSTLLEKYAAKFVSSLETYLAKPFPLPKLDFFASHTATDTILGMEHWGFISFDGNSVLDKNGLENFDNTETTIKVIAHEIVHQYFGNLVSLKELNSMWLKEGITTYFTSRVSAMVFPEEEYIQRMFLTDFGYAIKYEGSTSGVALNSYEMFNENVLDSLPEIHMIYTKGSVFTNMLSHVLGEEAFQRFIQNLVDNFEYDSISTDDFINELQYVVDMDAVIPENIDICGFVHSWINQPSFPIVTVTRNYDSGLVEISQTSLQDDTFWIPFNYATKSNPNFNVTTPDGWLRNVPSMNITVPNLKSDDWIMFNKHSTGYYVVNYDEWNWNLIIDVLSSDDSFHTIPPLNRAKLIIDINILHERDLMSDEILFRILNLLKREHNYITWQIVEDFLFWVPGLNLFVADNIDNLIGHFYAYYGTAHQPNDTRTVKIARSKAIEFGCMFNFKKCQDDMEIEATRIARLEGNFDEIDIDEPMFKMAYGYGVHNDEQFETFLRKVNTCKNTNVRTFFYENLEDKVGIVAFQKSYVATVYELPYEEDLLFNVDLMEMSIYYDLTILNDCLLANCYDFLTVFPNATERFEQIYKMIEKVMENLDSTKAIYGDGNTRFSTVLDVLENIDKIYGGNIVARAMSNYDVNKPQVSMRFGI